MQSIEFMRNKIDDELNSWRRMRTTALTTGEYTQMLMRRNLLADRPDNVNASKARNISSQYKSSKSHDVYVLNLMYVLNLIVRIWIILAG